MHIGKTAIRSAVESKSNIYVVGSSHVYWAYDPIEIEKVSGLPANIASNSSQTLEQSYFIIKKLIKKPETKVIFLETYMIKDEERRNTESISFNLAYDYLSFLDRIEVSKYYFDKYDFKYIFNFYKYHQNWKKSSIIKENLRNKKRQLGLEFTRSYHPLKGFVPHKNRKPDLNKNGYKKIPFDYFNKNLEVTNERKIHPQYEIILNELFEECKKRDIKLVLITSPFYYQNVSAELTCEYSNYISKIAKQHNSHLINFNYLYEELNLKRSHFKDSGHLNKYGAALMGKYIGKYTTDLLR